MKLKQKFLFFCIAGSIGAIVELVTFNLFYLIGFIFVLSKGFALLIALNMNFFINRKITFLSKGNSLKKQISKYIIIYSVALFVNFVSSLIINFLLPKTQFYANIAVISGIIIAIPISFFGSLLWVFKN